MSRRSEVGSATGEALAWIILLLLLVGMVGFAFWVFPRYGVYTQQLSGQAKLREAESSRQIAVLEAQAKAESAKLEAQAEIERAKGVAEANQIIGSSLSNNPEYLQYLYITTLQDQDGAEGDRTVIYVPTQDGMPVLPLPEASRLNN